MTVHVYVGMSLDGFIADARGGVGWLDAFADPDGGDSGFADFMAGIDAVVMGRRTFETVASFGGSWPYDKPVFVLSATLESLPDDMAGKAALLAGEPRDLVRELSRSGYDDLYVDGGQTIRGFLAADLVDELTLTFLPVVLGSGVPLFGELAEALDFALIGVETLPKGLVKCRYARVRH